MLPAGFRVLVTNPYAPPAVVRGSERMAVGLARWLRGAGVDAALAAGGSSPGSYHFDDVPVRTVRAPDLRSVWRELGPDLTFAPGLTFRLARDRPDLVHSLLYQDGSAARLARVPYLVTYAGMPLPRSFSGRPLNRFLFRWATEGARLVTCPSRAVAAHLLTTYGFSAEVIPYAVEVEFFAGPRSPVPGRIVSAGAPGDPRKRIQVLVSALPLVVKDCPEAHLWLAGPAPEKDRAELLARLPPTMRDRVAFVGNLDLAALRDLYLSAQVSCLPSLYEAFGLVVVESLASGAPVVGARHGALPELIDSDAVGRTFAADDEAELARRLVEMLRENARDEMAPACRASARRFSFDTVGPRYLAAYERCV